MNWKKLRYSELRPGMIVTITDDIHTITKEEAGIYVNNEMREMGGEEHTVKEVRDETYIKLQDSCWTWTKRLLVIKEWSH